MQQENTFIYKYSAKENAEIQNIRKRYMPQSEDRFEELKRLDAKVENSGIVESLCAGIGGFLLFGLGVCLSIQIIGDSILTIILGVLLGMVGLLGMVLAYPIYLKGFNRTKGKYTSRILELANEISEEI
ncbi:MAG: dihydropteridine reductase [Lachnospiraceae bacterium]|nr:dihydropteridine reductase [Lachnospiraceae bacterium]